MFHLTVNAWMEHHMSSIVTLLLTTIVDMITAIVSGVQDTGCAALGEEKVRFSSDLASWHYLW